MKRVLLFSLLFLLTVSWAAGEEFSSVWVGVPEEKPINIPDDLEQVFDIYKHRENALTRELPRQALLIAARDELGASTRDDMLFETAPEKAVKIEDASKIVPLTIIENSSASLFVLIPQVEKLSRNEYVAELKKRGVKPSLPDRPKNDDGKVPVSIMNSLRKMTLFDQYDAVRQIHKLIREKGDSPDRIRALVRGYLQLQLLTNSNFLDVHRVFQARAFLYQQRFKTKYGADDPETIYWDLAVRSLTHFFISADLKRKDLNKTKKQEFQQFEFLHLANIYSLYKTEELQKFENGPEKELALLLRYLLHEMSCTFYDSDTKDRRDLVNEICGKIPNCTRVSTEGFRSNTFEMLYLSGHLPFWKWNLKLIGPALQKMTEIPQNVLKQTNTLSSTEQLDLLLKTMKESVREQKDEEPSLEGLSVILRDEAFKTFYYIALGNKFHNGTPENFTDPLIEFNKKHPLFFMIDAFVTRDRKRNEKAFAEMGKVRYSLAKISQAAPMTHSAYYKSSNNSPQTVSPGFNACQFACPDNLRDFYWTLSWSERFQMLRFEFPKVISRFYHACSVSPLLCAKSLTYLEKQLSQKQIEDIKTRYAGYSNVFDALACNFIKTGNLDQWEKTLLEIPITLDSLLSLNKYYYYCNRTEDILNLTEKFLKTDESQKDLASYGAKMQAALSLLKEKPRNDLLQQYAEEAARCGSAWGLEIKANALRRNGQFTDSLKYFERLFQSYPESFSHRHLTIAYEFQTDQLEERLDEILLDDKEFSAKYKKKKDRYAPVTINEVMLACLISDRSWPQDLGPHPLENIGQWYSHPIAAWLAYFDLVKNKEDKKAAVWLDYLTLEGTLSPIGPVPKKWNSSETTDFFTFVPFARLIRKTISEKRSGAITEEEIRQLLNDVSSLEGFDTKRSTLLFLIGSYFEACGDRKRADEFYKRSLMIVHEIQDNLGTRSLALKKLRQSGFSQEDYQKMMFKENDPFNRIPPVFGTMNHFLYGAFPEYTNDPIRAAEKIKAKETMPEKIPESADKRHWRTAGTYRLNKVYFRNNVYDRSDENILWKIDDSFSISLLNDHLCFHEPNLGWRFCKGDFYLVNYGTKQTAQFLLGFYEDRMFAQIKIKHGELPSHPDNSLDQDSVRFEFVKIKNADSPTAAVSGKNADLKSKKIPTTDLLSGWIALLITPTALFIYGFALFLLFDLIIFIILYKKYLKKKNNFESGQKEKF